MRTSSRDCIRRPQWAAFPRTSPWPQSRWGSSLDYHDGLQGVVLSGGCADEQCTVPVQDTWLWNGARWARLEFGDAQAPTARALHSAAYDERRRRLVVTSGAGREDGYVGFHSELWELSEAGWTVIPYPVDYVTGGSAGLDPGFNLLSGLGGASTALHEWLGLTFYYLTGRTNAWYPA